jgi:MoxR-like ATPase
MWKALRSEEPCVVLVDEVDKAPRDFPNDLLGVLNDFEFEVPELERFPEPAVRARFPELELDASGAWRLRGHPTRRRPIVVATTNSERRLPEPFLRRCIFHVIELDRELVRRAWAARRDDPELQDLAEPVVEKAVSAFMALADNDKLRKPPSIAEFLGWLRLLALDPAAQDRLTAPLAGLPFLSALIKIDEDLAALAG